MGWEPIYIRQWVCISRLLVKISCTNSSRLNKRISLRASAKASSRCKNWYFVVSKRYTDLHVYTDINIERPISHILVGTMREAALSEFKLNWYRNINNETGPTGRGGNKLRTYCLLKDKFEVEQYCRMILPLRHRSAFAKFRCGVAPLRIETGRYENKPLDQRTCYFCNTVENEIHVIFHCNMYDDLRRDWFSKAASKKRRFFTLCRPNTS